MEKGHQLILWTLMFLAYFTACATSEHYARMLDTWKGKPVEELVAAMGEPRQTYTNEQGNQVYEYLRINRDLSALLRCVTKFEIDATGTILDYAFKGGNCAAYAPEG